MTIQTSNNASNLFTAKVNLPSARVKTLFSSPLVVIGTPPAGHIIYITGAICFLNYGGTNAFGTTQDITLVYSGTITRAIPDPLMTSATLSSTSSRFSIPVNLGSSTSGVAYSQALAKSISIKVGGEITGNAANDNTVNIVIYYRVISAT